MSKKITKKEEESSKDVKKDEAKVKTSNESPNVENVAAVTIEQVLTAFAERTEARLNAIFQMLGLQANAIKILNERVEAFPKGEVASALEAQAKIFQPFIQQMLNSPAPSLSDLIALVKMAQSGELPTKPIAKPEIKPLAEKPPA